MDRNVRNRSFKNSSYSCQLRYIGSRVKHSCSIPAYILLSVIRKSLHLPTTVFLYGGSSPNGKYWAGKFNIMERIQLVGFCIQEFVISAVYVWGTTRHLKSIYHSLTRRVLTPLIISIVYWDICLEFTNQYIEEAAAKAMIYAIKLKLEFAVLNQLMGLTKIPMMEGSRWIRAPAKELQDRSDQDRSDQAPTSAKLDAPHAPHPTKIDSWTDRGPRSDILPLDPVDQRRGVFKTQRIEIFREASPNAVNGDRKTSSPTAVAFSETGTLFKNVAGLAADVPHHATED